MEQRDMTCREFVDKLLLYIKSTGKGKALINWCGNSISWEPLPKESYRLTDLKPNDMMEKTE